MAVLIKELNKEKGHFESVGLVYNGKYVGDESFDNLNELNLGAEGAEDELVEEYDSHYLQATKVPDDDVDPEDFQD